MFRDMYTGVGHLLPPGFAIPGTLPWRVQTYIHIYIYIFIIYIYIYIHIHTHCTVSCVLLLLRFGEQVDGDKECLRYVGHDATCLIRCS